MKKTLYCLMAVLAVCFSFASCDDDDFNVNHGTHAQLPETVLAGTYSGTYTVFSADGVTVEKTVPGTITIAAGENKYTATFASASDEAVVNGAEENPIDVAWSNDEIKFWGKTTPGTTKGFLNSAVLNGTLSNGALTFRFSKTVRSGRKTVTNFYNFEGTK